MSAREQASELSRPVKVRQLPGQPLIVEADEAERAALARRFALPAVHDLRAEVDLERRKSAIVATGHLYARIDQECAISGEDFIVEIDEPLAIRFVEQESYEPEPAEEEASGEIEIELDAGDLDEIDYTGDIIDVGEAVAQSLGLAIDPYAEGPNADEARKSGLLSSEEASGPFAALAALKKD